MESTNGIPGLPEGGETGSAAAGWAKRAAGTDGPPLVSVIVANYNGAAYLPDLLKSLRRQSLAAIEIVVVDDASTDDSMEIAEEAARKDPRIVPLRLARNSGPGAARNRGIAHARGDWIAIVDSDDLVHPFRFERLLEMAEREGADIVADNLFVFHDDGTPPSLFLSGRRARVDTQVSLVDYLRENRLFGKAPALGYLKPVIRRSAIDRLGLRYNERLRIGEDYDFILRGLSHGLRFCISPFPAYCYRKHEQSISHRLGNCTLEAMEEADRAFLATCAPHGREAMRQARRRLASVQKARAWNGFVTAIKQGKLLHAIRTGLEYPGILPMLSLPLRARVNRVYRRFAQRREAEAAGKPAVCLISRQRLFSATSGSSHYVLSLVEALVEHGLEVHLIQPSPSVFGRWPVMYRGRRAKVFSSVHVRGGVFIGPVLVALNPAILLSFARAVAGRLLAKAGFSWTDRPAPYSVAYPWCAEDFVYTGQHAPRHCKAVLFDYAFQTVAAPYLPDPAARTLVIMHDLFSSRHAQFERLGQRDSLPAISEAQELQYLSGADAVVAIQPAEAEFVKTRAPAVTVVCAPMAVRPVDRPQPGSSRLILFAGTSTAPNVVGLNWFLKEVWPLIAQRRPQTVFWIAGSCGRALSKPPAGVKVLGVVPDLAPLYRDAGVVVSPLLSGSGLKIKLVESLAQGKAMVATPATIQGVEHWAASAVEIADTPEAFAARTIALLEDEALRTGKAMQALDAARTHFSAQACYREFLDLAAT